MLLSSSNVISQITKVMCDDKRSVCKLPFLSHASMLLAAVVSGCVFSYALPKEGLCVSPSPSSFEDSSATVIRKCNGYLNVPDNPVPETSHPRTYTDTTPQARPGCWYGDHNRGLQRAV